MSYHKNLSCYLVLLSFLSRISLYEIFSKESSLSSLFLSYFINMILIYDTFLVIPTIEAYVATELSGRLSSKNRQTNNT